MQLLLPPLLPPHAMVPGVHVGLWMAYQGLLSFCLSSCHLGASDHAFVCYLSEQAFSCLCLVSWLQNLGSCGLRSASAHGTGWVLVGISLSVGRCEAVS